MEQTLAELQKLYVTAGPYFLTDFFKPNGDKHLYEFLMSTYKPAFENNFRIIIVQDCQDDYEYQDLPGRAISTLQKYASQIDISNFFILVLSGNPDISQELDHAKRLYSTDDVSIQYQYIRELTYVKTEHKKQDTFCILPWMHLYIGPDGNVLPCCVADQQYPIGSINEHSIDSILKSNKFNRLRQNMLEGKRSKECNRCYQQEDANLPSNRIGSNFKWSDRIVQFNSDGSVDNFKPLYLDLRLNNICNLKCRMCSGYFSSAIAQEDQKLFGNSKYLENTLSSDQKTLILEEILDYLPHAENIYFAGGEPLLAGEHYTILDKLIECGNTDLEIFYNTNFTSLHYKNRSVIDLWKKFTNVTIGASIDAMGAVAEYVRHGTNWNVIESNLNLLKSECSHVVFTVTSAVGCLNVNSLIDLQKTWHNNNTVDISKFQISTMVGPDYLTLQILPAHHKHRLEQNIKDHIQWCKKNNATDLADQWGRVLNFMFSKDSTHLLPKFKQLTNSKDLFRNESLLSVVPEFSDIL